MPLGEADRRAVEALAALVSESLRLWRVAGRVEPAADGFALALADGRRLAVRRVADDDLFGWRVTLDGGRERPAASALGVLAALRGALDPEPDAARLRPGFVEAAP